MGVSLMRQLRSWPFFAVLSALLLVCQMQATQADGLPDFTKLLEGNSGAVVNISTTSKRTPPGHSGKDEEENIPFPDIPEDSPFRDFLKKFFEGEIPGPGQAQPRASLGSGFIISADGYVITNNHVIKEADEIIVRLSDRREFAAKLVGQDERSDLAVLKIEAAGLPAVKIGDSDKLKVGEWVLAIGSPFGFDASVTAGIVSAKGRSLPNENYIPFIQTDAAINPGNSGGPLFNLSGEVVGVNSQIYSRTGGFMGLSFAIPINMVMNVYQELRDKGRVVRGWLGVLIQDVNRDLAESFGMDKPQGALVAKVLPDGPGDKGGLKEGDVIVSFDGKPINQSADLPPIVGASKVDAKLPVEVYRGGKKMSLTVVIGELPKEEEAKLAAGKPGSSSKPSMEKRINIAVKELNKEEREKLDAPENGVLVTDVDEGPASRAGIRAGDVIVLLNNEKVEGLMRFRKIVTDLPADKSVPVLINRRGSPIFLAIKLGEQAG
jgi:serine protease Do